MQDQPPITTSEIRVVDAKGYPRIILSARDGDPTVVLLRDDATPGARLALDAAGRPSASLMNPLVAGPAATLEIDDKGAHVRFDRPGGASAYLFLNNAGASGVVLIDTSGTRRISATVAADGTSNVEHFAVSGRSDSN